MEVNKQWGQYGLSDIGEGSWEEIDKKINGDDHFNVSHARIATDGDGQPLTPERVMFAAMLTRALDDYMGFDGADKKPSPNNTRITIQEDARLWIESNRSDEASFVWVCQMLNYDPSYVRRMASHKRTRYRKRDGETRATVAHTLSRVA